MEQYQEKTALDLGQSVSWEGLSTGDKAKLLARPEPESAKDLEKKVQDIIAQVKIGGDRVLSSLSKKFDQVDQHQIEVSQEEWNQAEDSIPQEKKMR